jgi:hypothetical protein
MTILKLLGYLFAFLLLVSSFGGAWISRMGMSHLETLGEVIAKSHMERRHEVVGYIDRKWKTKMNLCQNWLSPLNIHVQFHSRTTNGLSKTIPGSTSNAYSNTSQASVEQILTSNEMMLLGELILR